MLGSWGRLDLILSALILVTWCPNTLSAGKDVCSPLVTGTLILELVLAVGQSGFRLLLLFLAGKCPFTLIETWERLVVRRFKVWRDLLFVLVGQLSA